MKKNIGLIILTIILTLILCGGIAYLSFSFGKESIKCPEVNDKTENKEEVKQEETQKPSENENGETKSLSLNDAEVYKIVDKYDLKHDSELFFLTDVYSKKKLDDKTIYSLAFDNSEILNDIHDYNEHPKKDIVCTNKYVKYNDMNNSYKLLTGKTLNKIDYDLNFLGLLMYDSEKNIYRSCYDSGSGYGGDIDYVSKLEKAEQKGNYIYIYEKVGAIEWTSQYNLNYFNCNENCEVGLGENYDIDNILHLLETYKWTFKKDSNGEYIYESIEYVGK